MGRTPAGRLTGLANRKADDSNLSSYTYTLDALGNHISVSKNEPLNPTLAGQDITYTYDAENRLTQAGSNLQTYDDNGNLTARGADTFAYDYNNRLIQSSLGGEITQYSYDGLGNRLAKVKGGQQTRYVLDVNGRLSNVLSETDSNRVIASYYLYVLGLIARVLPDGTPTYYHYDSRGSTIALTDSNQNQTDAYAYGSFGNVSNNSGSTPNPFKYVGRYGLMDEGNGVNYVRARYYQPELGRFLTKDPMTGTDGDGQSLNRYMYALNNPVRLIDFTGYSALEGPTSNTFNLSSDNIHDLLLNSDYNALRQYLVNNVGISLIDETMKEVEKVALKAIIKDIFLIYLPENTSYSTNALAAANSFFISYLGPTLGFLNVYSKNKQDVYNHPERDMVEVAARLSIDVTVTAISGVASLLSGFTAGFAMSTAYSANREEIQNGILHNPITDTVGNGLYNVGHGNWFGNMLGF